MSGSKLDGLERRVFNAGGRLQLTIEEILEAFDRKSLTSKARDEMWEQLVLRRQVNMKPGPHQVQAGERTTLTTPRGR